jgi:hypothetical protein
VLISCDALSSPTGPKDLDTYSHVLPGMGDSLANTMDEAFG